MSFASADALLASQPSDLASGGMEVPPEVRTFLKESSLSDKRSPVSKSWFLTLNNYSEEEEDRLRSLECNYLMIARETGAENGVPHLHAVVTFSKAYRRSALAKIVPRAYWAVLKSREHAVNYLMKQDLSPFIKDNRTQGTRTDLEDFCQSVKTNGLYGAINADPSTYVKYHAGLDKYSMVCQVPRDPAHPPEVVWLYGATGVGKSRYVHEREKDLYVCLSTHKWWQGYRQQEAIIIDDMRCNFAPFNDLLKILDRYPYTVEVKGSSAQLNSPRIYVTSQFPPHKVYNRDNRSGEDIRQLYRRLTKVVLMSLDSDGKTLMQEQDKEMLVKEDESTHESPTSSLVAGFLPFR